MRTTIETWLSRDPDPETRAELQALLDKGDEAELQRRFSGRLAFGTAGLRGVVGAGPARMNRLVIQETSVGLGQYLLHTVENASERGIVVGYDGRLHSRIFAEDTASMLTALGLKVYLSTTPVATPVCAYGVSTLNAAAGVMVTASHNPPEYNGYKVYWGNGAQIVPPHDTGIAATIHKAAAEPLPQGNMEEARAKGLLVDLSAELQEEYRKRSSALAGNDHADIRASLRIAYTPLHGVGAAWTEDALQRAGFHEVHTVPSQREPDGHFPTVRFPNPEEPGAMDAVLDLAAQIHADLIIANDPDADRLAAAVPTPEKGYQPLTGNQIGVLLGESALRKMQGPSSIGTTIVSSQLLGKIAEKRGAYYFETLTGFKWIANRAMEREQEGETFLFGYEEALGYTVGDLVRDKDGVSAAACFAALVAELKAEGKTVLEHLESIYREFGIYATGQKSLPLGPNDEKPQDQLRQTPPTTIAGKKVVASADLLESVRHFADGRQETIHLPKSDVLTYHLEGGSRVIVRPSGTEPKLKCYYEVREVIEEGEDFQSANARAQESLKVLIAQHQSELKPA